MKNLIFFVTLPFLLLYVFNQKSLQFDSLFEFSMTIFLFFRSYYFGGTLFNYIDKKEALLLTRKITPYWQINIIGNFMWGTVFILVWFGHPWYAICFLIIEGLQISQDIGINKTLKERNNTK